MFVLTPVEARVIGSLIEKEITTPEYYPLSLNALVNACNQKSSRDPVLALSEADVRGALFALEESSLVRVIADGRVSKFEHRMRDQVNLRRDEVAVICLLLLRGPQTPAELRARADRLYTFDDTAAVTNTLERLAAREEPLTRAMGRQPGAREVRWQHLFYGVNDVQATALTPSAQTGREADETTSDRIAALEERVRQLEERLTRLDGAL